MKKIKIILQIQSLAVGKGGAERVATDLADQMTLRGHDIYMAYKDIGPPAYKSEQAIKYLPYKNLKELSKIVRNIDADAFFSFYVNHLIIENYSVVHNTNIPFGMQECTNPIRAVDNNWRKGNSVNKIQSMWEREIIASGAHRIRLVMPGYSHSFPEYVRKQVRGFSNPAFPQKKHAKHEDHQDERRIINIGGMKDNKNLIELINAFILVKDKFPKWKIHVFGKDASKINQYIEAVLKIIRNNALENRIIIRGSSDDIFNEFANSDIHVISSLEEGCPTCVLEAMASGVPSIGFTECAGTNELIVDGVNGLLVSSEDRVLALADAMCKLMESNVLRAKYGSKALLDSMIYDPKNTYDQWERLFIEMAEYKDNPNKLMVEQMSIDPERALHAQRMRLEMMKAHNNLENY